MTLNGPRGRVRRRITDDLLDEMTAWSPAERVRIFRTWLRGSLSLIHLHVLTVLEVEGSMAMGRLAEALDVSVASATGIVDRMEQRGLVERQAQTTDRRVIEVHPTAPGAAVFDDLLTERRAHLEVVLGELSDRELASLLVGLRALHRARAKLTPPTDAGIDTPASPAVASAVRRPRVARATGG
jgi:DNA-binding MarR family transcriptional regulator